MTIQNGRTAGPDGERVVIYVRPDHTTKKDA